MRRGPGRPRAGRYRVGAFGSSLWALLLVAALLGAAWVSSRPAADGPVPVETTTVTVGAGETVWSIARRTVPESAPAEVVERIRLLNGPDIAELRVGRVLRVPAAGRGLRG
ncbi:hypothetical protein AHOG_08115 [Actinoalloteichus hoggarensis]|uniref:LysM domain-containing protein n=1 Tax=Actinoalloteichus hoggarensis TaxID=1470176 RepID=A0A221W0K1_9PSEU|nr:hypothetical protein AHOG_08115 [Actinoalloteichus hoggarensis]